MSWPLVGQLTQNEGAAATDCHAGPKPTYRLRRWGFLAGLHSRIWRHGAHRGADLKGFPQQPRAFRFATHYPVRFPWGLDSKGGGRGDILFSKENIPFGFRCPLVRGASAGNPGPLRERRKWGAVCSADRKNKSVWRSQGKKPPPGRSPGVGAVCTYVFTAAIGEN